MSEQSISPSTAQPAAARRAAIYIRTSPNPELGESSDMEPLQAYAAHAGYAVVAEYRDDDAKGHDLNRSGLNHLRADAAQGRFDLVLVAHRARFADAPVDAQIVVDELHRHGVTVETLGDDTPPPQSRTATPSPAATRTAPVRAAVNPADLRVGMEVFGSNGGRIGIVKEVRAADIWVDRTWQRDLFVPLTAIQAVNGTRIVLDILSGHADSQGWARPFITGQRETAPPR